MEALLEPLKTDSLKDALVTRFEELILSGHFKIGQRLPAERELALQLGVSRPVVHEGLVELAARGLVTLTPRVGTVVNDYRREGSLTLLSSLVQYHKGRLEPRLLESMLQLRLMIEPEFARLAAENRTDDHIGAFHQILAAEESTPVRHVRKITDLDFEFHLLIAVASGNTVYPLLLNSFRPVYTNLSGQFFKDAQVMETVHRYHRNMVRALEQKNARKAVSTMKAILNHGEKYLRKMIDA